MASSLRPPSRRQTGSPTDFAENVPQRNVDRADRGDRHAAPRDLRHGMAGRRCGGGARAVVQHFPDRADVARIAADQLRPDLVVQHMHQRAIGAGAAGGVLAFAPADDAVVGLDAQDRRIERPHLTEVAPVLARRFDGYANPPGFDLLDAHFHSPPIRERADGSNVPARA